VPTHPIPTDVIWARGVRFHLQALYACAGLVLLLAVIGYAATAMAGPLAQDPPITAGVLALVIGGACALAGALAAGFGQVRVLAAARADHPDAMAAVTQRIEATRALFALLPRAAIAGAVALVAAYTFFLRPGVWGAVVGAFVIVQVALALGLIRKTVLGPGRLQRR